MVLPLSLKKSVFCPAMCYSVLKVCPTPSKTRRFKYLSPRQDFKPFLYPIHHAERQKHSKHANLENTSMFFTLSKSVLHFCSCLWHCGRCRCTYWKIWQSFCSVLSYTYFIFKHRSFILIFPFLFSIYMGEEPFTICFKATEFSERSGLRSFHNSPTILRL